MSCPASHVQPQKDGGFNRFDKNGRTFVLKCFIEHSFLFFWSVTARVLLSNPHSCFGLYRKFLHHLQVLMRSADSFSDCQLLQILCWFILGGTRQHEPFTGALQGVRGGGTNPVVGIGHSLRGHHLQAASEDAESRGYETGLQITVWRANAVTFVCWWHVTLSATGWNIVCFLCSCIIKIREWSNIATSTVHSACLDCLDTVTAASYISSSSFFFSFPYHHQKT